MFSMSPPNNKLLTSLPKPYHVSLFNTFVPFKALLLLRLKRVGEYVKTFLQRTNNNNARMNVLTPSRASAKAIERKQEYAQGTETSEEVINKSLKEPVDQWENLRKYQHTQETSETSYIRNALVHKVMLHQKTLLVSSDEAHQPNYQHSNSQLSETFNFQQHSLQLNRCTRATQEKAKAQKLLALREDFCIKNSKAMKRNFYSSGRDLWTNEVRNAEQEMEKEFKRAS